MAGQEDNLVLLSEFLEKPEKRLLVIYLASNGQLTPDTAFPSSSKNKAVYFIKRQPEQVKKENVKTLLLFGDVSHVPLDQLSNLVESVSEYITLCSKSISQLWHDCTSDEFV